MQLRKTTLILLLMVSLELSNMHELWNLLLGVMDSRHLLAVYATYIGSSTSADSGYTS